MKKALIISLMLLVFSFTNTINATTQVAQIDVYKPASSDPVILVYWNYSIPKGCDRYKVLTLFQALKEAQRILKSSIYRFISEHPNQFDQLALLRFENASDPRKAEVIYGVYVLEEGRTGGAVTIYGDRAWELHLDCKLAEMDYSIRLNVAMHELLHTLGVGHVHEGGEDFEIMGASINTYYPSTLDLFGIYQAMFEKKWNEPAVLPEWIKWEPVIPYNMELQQLREENQKLQDEVSSLRSDLNKLKGKLDQANDLITVITQENQQLKTQASNLRESLESLTTENAALRSQLQEYENMIRALNQTLAEKIKTLESQQTQIQSLKAENQQLSLQLSELQTSLSRAEAENQALRQQLQQANQTIQALAILAICLTATTIAAITLKKRR